MRTTIDASVVGELLFPENFGEEADGILSSTDEFIAPASFEVEMLAITSKWARRGRVTPEYARAQWVFGTSLPVDYIPITRYAEQAFDLSVELSHPSYDCLYLAVAITEYAPLVTADRRFYDKVSASKYAPFVRWIGDV
jgi:predicted nucleic acid-binding protein